MLNHPTAEQIQGFRYKSLSPALLLEVSNHFKECASCRTMLARAAHTCHTNRHLTYEQKEGYLDDQITSQEREVVENHIQMCESCAGELDHLREFSSMLMQTPLAQRSYGS